MNQKLIYSDFLSIHDVLKDTTRMDFQIQNRSPFLGLVRIFENGKLNTDQTEDGWLTNMTVATGREFVAQAIYKKNSPHSVFGDIKDYKVDSFGIGSGGSSIDVHNNVTLIGPQLCDTGLYAPIPINSQCISAKNNNGELIQHTVKGIQSAGPGNDPGSIIFETHKSPDFQECNVIYYNVVKNSCVVEMQEPTTLSPGESVRVDEAMLFMTSPNGENPLPFAHICFAPKFIELESRFEIEWYVIC